MNETLRTLFENNILLISLIPAILSVGLAFKFKNVFLSLGFGLYSGLVIDAFLNGSGIVASFIVGIFNLPIYLTESLGTTGNAGIVMQMLLISGLIYLLTYTGGLRAFANSIVRFANNRKNTQLITWLMGLAVFFDDYANALIVGPVMKNITDKARISREKLAFIIDATAAPIAGLVIISTWIGYEISLITDQLTNVGIDAPAMGIFIQSIPFRFYNVLMLIFIVLTIVMRREFGPMYKAELRAATGKTNYDESKIDHSEIDDVEVNENYQAKAYEGIIPLLVLIIGSFYFFYHSGAGVEGVVLKNPDSLTNIAYNIATAFSNADTSVVLSQAAFLAILVTFVLSGVKGAFKFADGIDITIRGAIKLVPTTFVLLLAWSLGTIMDADHLNTGANIASILGDSLPYQLIPLIIFLISSLMAFATGTSYGTMGILFPLSIPLAYSANPELSFVTLVVGAILTGTILGDHCSPISDTTLLSSAGAEVDHLAHVETQMPYALVVGGFSAIGYLISGFIIESAHVYLIILGLYVVLIFGMYLTLKTIGKEIPKFSVKQETK